MPSLPDPLHPALVHLPLGLAVLLPLATLLCLAAIARGFLPARAWWGVVLVAAVLAAGSLATAEAGEDQAERVEPVVGKDALHAHEERGEWFVRLAIGTAVLAATGLLGGRPGRVARIATLAASVLLLAAGIRAGESGGHLVYVHGAANAYLDPAHGGAPPPAHVHEP